MISENGIEGLAWGPEGMVPGTEFVRAADAGITFPAPLTPITSVVVENAGGGEQALVPVTFGQVFAEGEFMPSDFLVGSYLGARLPLQADVKAMHGDGSVRHAVISAVLPALAADGAHFIELCRSVKPAPHALPTQERAGATASVVLTLGGERYTAKSADINPTLATFWLQGPVVGEMQFVLPLRNAAGVAHPHLSVRYNVRDYLTTGRARVEIVVENTQAYEPNPQNFTYDVEIAVGGRQVYSKQGLVHYHHARWRKLFWVGQGGEPQVHIRHDTGYLITSRALPNYDQSTKVWEKTLAEYDKKWTDAASEPMQVGPLVMKGMPTMGGRNDLGLLPGWAAAYLLSMDPRAKKVTLGHADLAGSWSMHYRDQDTGLPISLIDKPYMTILGTSTDTKNPNVIDPKTGKKGKLEAFPSLVKAQSKTPYTHDAAHQPAFAYLPYLVTGDYYYLEELQFWAMWNVFRSNPGYRKNIQGLLARDQVRAQAWNLRTLGEAAYITPDAHPLKGHFLRVLDSNLDSYNTTFSDNPLANKLGVLDMGNASVYSEDTDDDGVIDKKTAVAPWQDDFFTSAVGHLADLGFEKAKPLLRWKLQFPVLRMLGVCWVAAAHYTYAIRPKEGAPIFGTIQEAYAATVGAEVAKLQCGDAVSKALGQKPGSIGNYPTEVTGFAANMQPALAYAADYGGEDAKKAWALFAARAVKPDYGKSPQFAIVPRV